MWIYYDTKTGNVQRFIDKIKAESEWHIEKISSGMQIEHPGHLITFTTRFGDIPDSTLSFLQSNSRLINSISSSGNRNWGKNFALAADRVSGIFGIPVALKFELSGTKADVTSFINAINNIDDCQEMDPA